MTGGLLIRWDYAFSSICLTHRFNKQVAGISRVFSHSGDGPYYFLCALGLALLEPVHGWQLLQLGLLTFAFEVPLYLLLKNTIKRQRPAELPTFIVPKDRYSLPSGHAAAAFCFATLVSSFYPQWQPWLLLWASGVALSRVLLGVHFISDVLIGAALGYGCAVWMSGVYGL